MPDRYKSPNTPLNRGSDAAINSLLEQYSQNGVQSADESFLDEMEILIDQQNQSNKIVPFTRCINRELVKRIAFTTIAAALIITLFPVFFKAGDQSIRPTTESIVQKKERDATIGSETPPQWGLSPIVAPEAGASNTTKPHLAGYTDESLIDEASGFFEPTFDIRLATFQFNWGTQPIESQTPFYLLDTPEQPTTYNELEPWASLDEKTINRMQLERSGWISDYQTPFEQSGLNQNEVMFGGISINVNF